MALTVIPEADPHGDREWLEQQRKKKLGKGREAILGATFEDFPPPPEGGGGDGGDGGGGTEGEDKPRIYRGLRIESINAEGMSYWRTLGHPPEGCPVTCLGRDGKVFYFLTPGGQLVSYEDGKFGRAHIAALFAGQAMDWLIRAYPQKTAQGRVKGFQADLAQIELFAACDAAGVFDAREKVRGLGCWRGENGELIQHLGDVVLIGERREKPGMIDGYVYPGRPAVAPPLPGGIEASMEVYGDLLTWNWSRGGLDARLLLGWMGCAIMGAALDWRPMIFMTGDAGSGKSSVQERVKKLLPGRLASTVDATPAALRQIVNQDAIGVSFDEIEADMNTSQGTDVMKLARVAASGGTTYRGGKDHNASEFTLRGCFAFSAIVPPSMRVQDMQRLAFLRLGPLPKGGRMAEYTDAQLKTLGQKMAGRIAEGWARWPAVLRVFEEALIRLGHNQRGAKQFGTLLAAAELLTSDETPSDKVADNLARGLARDALYEYESADPTWLLVLRHVLSAQPEVWRNLGSPTVAEVIRSWMQAVSDEDRRREQVKLNRAGLAMCRDRTYGQPWLAIPARHQQIQAMFSQTDFRAHGGEGTWTSSLRNADKWNPDEKTGVYRVEAVPQLGRVKCTLMRLSATVTISGKTVPIFDEDPEKVGDEAAAA
jgi:hypothetical protein